MKGQDLVTKPIQKNKIKIKEEDLVTKLKDTLTHSVQKNFFIFVLWLKISKALFST